jgi:ABC-type spermidine/putrescine transport system permease subunit I
MDNYGEDGSFAIFQLLGIVVALVIAFLVGRDANQRGMSGIGWGIFTFFLCIVAVPIYLVVRQPRTDAAR